MLYIRRAVAQPGSAPRSGRGGRWFESSLPDRQNQTGKNKLLFDFFI